MVICFEIAKNRDKKEQAFHNDCPFKPLKPLLITNINQTIVVRYSCFNCCPEVNS